MRKLLGVTLIFIIGLAAGLYAAQAGDVEQPDSSLIPFQTQSIPSPKDRITERQIEVYSSRIILDIQDAQWAKFTDTKSMEPVIHAGSNAIEVVPESEDDIQVGDIISYSSEFSDGYIIHRVVYKGEDENGTYFILKGDNVPTNDPGRVRFGQIKSVVVAIIY